LCHSDPDSDKSRSSIVPSFFFYNININLLKFRTQVCLQICFADKSIVIEGASPDGEALECHESPRVEDWRANS
jgi:hypothetical protein